MFGIFVGVIVVDKGWFLLQIYFGLMFVMLMMVVVFLFVVRLLVCFGGRLVVISGILLIVVSCVMMVWCFLLVGWYGVWLLIGIGMWFLLYDVLFVVVVNLYGQQVWKIIFYIIFVGGLVFVFFWLLGEVLLIIMFWQNVLWIYVLFGLLSVWLSY